MAWRIAESLLKLQQQINAQYPNRDKKSDGGIGDAAHATRSSDHNPWVKDGKMGVVTAIDIDEDLSASIHSLQHVVDTICASKDPRVKYVIYERRITVKGSNLQAWQAYHGTNAHEHHAHISVFSDKSLYDDDRDWSIDATNIIAEPTDENNSQYYYVVRGDTLGGIARKFTTSVDALMELNFLRNADIIVVGQRLQVK